MKFIGTALLWAVFASRGAVAGVPEVQIRSVGAIAINPCQDAKVLASWYSKFGIETREIDGGYYGELETAAGPLVFGIHPAAAGTPRKCSASVSVVYRVDSFEVYVLSLKKNGLVPDSTEKDAQGQFAHFHDPDGNEVTVWGQ